MITSAHTNRIRLTYHTKTEAKTSLSILSQLKACALAAKAFGQLVVLGFDVTVFTPAPYQRRRLQRPSMEFSSRGGLRT